jgi:hypothetical protein
MRLAVLEIIGLAVSLAASLGLVRSVGAQENSRAVPASGAVPQGSRLPAEFQDLGMKIKEPFTFAGGLQPDRVPAVENPVEAGEKTPSKVEGMRWVKFVVSGSG